MTHTQQPAVVLLHSSASSARQWQPLVDQLQQRLRCRPVDLHGHGAQRDWPNVTPLSLADEAALVEAELAHEALPVHLVGHSYGAAVALKFAAQNPGRVRSVVVYEPVLFRLLVDDPHSRSQAHEALALGEGVRTHLAAGDPMSAAEHFVSYWSGRAGWQGLSATRREAVATRMQTVLWHFDALYSEPLGLKQLARLRLPVLCLTGSHTTAVAQRIGELLREGLSTARHEVLPGLGHMGPITHATSVNPLVAQFLFGDGASHHPSPMPQGLQIAATQS